MKAVVAAFNQEKALVGAFSVITNLRMERFEALAWTRLKSAQYLLHQSGQAAGCWGELLVSKFNLMPDKGLGHGSRGWAEINSLIISMINREVLELMLAGLHCTAAHLRDS